MAVRLLTRHARHPSFTRKFVKAAEIQVGIKVTHQPHVRDHLMAEVYISGTNDSVTSRHLYAKAAEIGFAVENITLVLRIAIGNLKGEAFPHFALYSTMERSVTLGNHVGVEPRGHSRSVVMSPIAL